MTSRSLMVWPWPERPHPKWQQVMISSLAQLCGCISPNPIRERLSRELAEDKQTRLVSTCVPCPRSLTEDWAAWQEIVHLRNELTGGAERLLRGKARAQMAWIILT